MPHRPRYSSSDSAARRQRRLGALRLQLERLEGRDLLTATPTMVANINPTGGSNASEFVDVGGILFFSAEGPSLGAELWKTDGTAAGTVMVKDINPTGSSFPGLARGQYMAAANVNGTLFFSATNGTNGFQLWKSNGTSSGTVVVKDVGTGATLAPLSMTNVGGTLYFGAAENEAGTQFGLWKSDGTSAGTQRITGLGTFLPDGMTNVNGTLFFRTGLFLWKSDGTAAGTSPVWGGVGTFDPAAMNGNIYFNGDSGGGGGGNELWTSNGTSAGTTKVADINPLGTSWPTNLVNVNGTLFFFANDAIWGRELWKSDGTAAGTMMVRDIRVGPSGSGTATSNMDGAKELSANVNGVLYFVADDGVHGAELWTSDGTTAGTVIAADINPGSAGSSPAWLTNVNGKLFFSADNGTAGIEPYILLPPVPYAQLFYNNSRFDADAGISVLDDRAIAIDKSPYIAGQGTATMTNLSSYTRGINGLMIDLQGSHPGITSADFTFKVGVTNTPSTWTTAPAPLAISVRAGAGFNGADRVSIIWNDNAINKTWLQVTVAANASTGLAQPYTFYFGNMIGETGAGNTTGFATVNATDELAARANAGITLVPNSLYDFNRDRVVDAMDQLAARGNLGFVRFINVAAGTPLNGLALPAGSPQASPATTFDANAAVAATVTTLDAGAPPKPARLSAKAIDYLLSVSHDELHVLDHTAIHVLISTAPSDFDWSDHDAHDAEAETLAVDAETEARL